MGPWRVSNADCHCSLSMLSGLWSAPTSGRPEAADEAADKEPEATDEAADEEPEAADEAADVPEAADEAEATDEAAADVPDDMAAVTEKSPVRWVSRDEHAQLVAAHEMLLAAHAVAVKSHESLIEGHTALTREVRELSVRHDALSAAAVASAIEAAKDAASMALKPAGELAQEALQAATAAQVTATEGRSSIEDLESRLAAAPVDIAGIVQDSVLAHVNPKVQDIVADQVASLVNKRMAQHVAVVEARLDAMAPDAVARSSAEAANAAKSAVDVARDTLEEIRDLKTESLAESLADAAQGAADRVREGMLAGLAEGRGDAITAAQAVARESMAAVLVETRSSMVEAVSGSVRDAALVAHESNAERLSIMVDKKVGAALDTAVAKALKELRMDATMVATKSVEEVHSVSMDLRSMVSSLDTRLAAKMAELTALSRDTIAAKPLAAAESPTCVAALPATPPAPETEHCLGVLPAPKSILDDIHVISLRRGPRG